MSADRRGTGSRQAYLLVLLLLGSCLFPPPMAADGTTEHGLSRISHYPPHSYNGHSQVFQSVQAADGVLYFTNYGAVLTWDGERWDRIPIPGAGFLYGIAALGGKRFAVCGVNTIALMEPDGTGAWAVRSLVEDLPPEERENLGEIWDLQATPEGLYFFSRRRMFRWTPEGCRVWHFETEKMIYGFWSGSSVYVQNLDDGLYRLEEDALISVSKDPLFRNPGPRMISDWEGGRLLIATMRDGLRLFDGENLTPFAAEAEAYLSESVVNRGIRLADGRLALGTFHGGLAIIDESGHFQRLFSEEGGLPNNTITHLSEDREGGVWVSMGSGIARVEVDGIITRYDRSTGLPNVVVSGILRHKDRLFLASSDGLHRLRAGDPPNLPQWEPVPSTGGEVHAMVPQKEALFATTKGRVIRFDGNESEVVWDDFGLLRALHVMKKVDDHILVGGRIGLGLVYREDNQWKQAGPLPGLEDHVLSVTEDAEGNIWLGTVFSGVLRVRSEGTATSWMENAEIDRFGAESGLASVEHVTVRYENNRIMAFPPSGPQVFDEASGRFTALEETSSLPPPEGWAWDVKVESERHGTWGSVYPLDDAEEDFRLYFGGRSPAGDWRWVSPEIFEEIGGVLFLYLEKGEPDILWAGGWSGLLRWEVGEGLSDLKSETLQVGVRKISLPNGTTTGAADGISFSHHRGALVFQYSAPVYTPGVKVSYRTLLEGYDKAWSEWSDEAERSFTNLPGGTYRFRVEARTPSGLSAQANLAGITVLPPWYLSPFALAGYLAVAGLLVWGGARLRLAALRRENRRLEAIVGERTAALAENERELRKARDAADHANRQKSRFLANMSHELRTPLNAIMGYAHVLDRDPHLDERNRQRVGILNTSCNRLVHLINEILDLSKIEAGRLEVHEQPTDLAAGIRALLDSFGARAAQKGIALACDADPGFPDRVLTDLRKVEQILGNLVGNGLKFTEEGEVRVVLAKESGQIRLDVVDTGIGIPADEAEAVFDAFHQTGESPGKEAGTGLGLAISRRLAEAMGGSLDCASGPGEGTRFRLRLPLKAAADAKSAPEKTSSRRIGYAGRPRTVLVIDDVAANRDVVDELLSPLGFSVETAASGGEALARIAAGGVDTVLLDVRMKPMGGAEVLRQLRALPGGAGLPVISYSASLIGFTRADALAMGCDDWLPKPFPPEDLFKKLGDLLQLDWQFAAAEAPSLPLAGKYRFTKRDLGTLRALAYRREPAGLKSALQAIRSREPESAATVDPLLDLVSRFRISEISEQLETLPVREEPT